MNNKQAKDIVCVEGLERLLSVKKNVQELFLKVFDKVLSDDAWRHFYINAPYGLATVFVCYGEDGIIAHGGIIPQQLISKEGKMHEYYLQTAIMVDSNYRTLSLFKELMEAIHRYVMDKETFTLAFPNDNSYLPFIKMLQWRKIREYNIRQYCSAGDAIPTLEQYAETEDVYKYSLILDDAFLKWRGQLNNLKVLQTPDYRVIYKDYKGALDLLDAQGEDIPFREIMVSLGYERINIPECFLPGKLRELRYIQDVGIPQRMCVYPAEYAKLDYESIRPSLLLSDVF